MNVADELVLAVPTAALFAKQRVHGALAGAQELLRFVFDPSNSRFLARRDAEQDPAWKQIIPYVILYCGDQVFTYKRGKASGESRLVAQTSIGVGGHVNPTDESIFAAPGWPAYEAALDREVDEEIEIPSGLVGRRRMVGVINDDSNEVGKVHFGIIHLWELSEPVVKRRESKIAQPRFESIDNLRAAQGQSGYIELETWSRFCMDQWDALQSEPGWLPE